MAKYDFAFKLAIVKAYENGEGGYRFLAKKFNIPSFRTVEKWVKTYQTFGKEALERKRKNKTYTVQLS